jgi:hypothetical protein
LVEPKPEHGYPIPRSGIIDPSWSKLGSARHMALEPVVGSSRNEDEASINLAFELLYPIHVSSPNRLE